MPDDFPVVDEGEFNELADMIASWRVDPVRFVLEGLDATPQPWQAEALYGLAERKQAAIRSCHGPGKTTLGAWAIWWFLSTRGGVRAPCTAPTNHQLRDVLWPEIGKWLARSPLLQQFFEWQATRIVYKRDPNDRFAVAVVGSTPEALAGFHAEHLLYVVDEASGIPDEMMAAVEGARTNLGAYVLMLSNPTRRTGYFFDAFHKNRALWYTQHVSHKDSDRVSDEYAERMAAQYGRDSSVYQVRVLGDFPTESVDALLALDVAERAIELALEPVGPVVLGVDVARFGDNESVILERQGPVVREIETHRGKRVTELTGLVIQAIRRTKAERVYIDEPGLGGGLVDGLVEAQARGDIDPGVAIIPVNVGRAAVATESFVNLRAESYWRVKRLFETFSISIPADDPLIAQLTTIQWRTRPDGKIVIESKDDMRHRRVASPDRADALVLTYVEGESTAELAGVLDVTVALDLDLRMPGLGAF